MAEPKAGKASTEFGLAGLAGVLVTFNDQLAGLSTPELIALVGLASIYILSRSWVKAASSVAQANVEIEKLNLPRGQEDEPRR